MWVHILDEHAQALIEDDEAKRQKARVLALGQSELIGLMDTAERLRDALRPTSPRPEFRQRLKAQLVRDMRRRALYRTILHRSLRSYWVWGAVMSLVSLAGGVGYYLHRRSQAA